MAKKDTIPKDETAQDGLTVQPTPMHADTNLQTPSFNPNPGEYHLVRLDADGKEIIGSDFSVGERTYNRSFKERTEGNNPQYLLKKNPK